MNNYDENWTRRHIAFFRNQRGHGACTVEGCLGAQPLMWVPTEAEVRFERRPRGQAVDLPSPTLAKMWPRRTPPLPRAPRPDAHREHIHWAGPGGLL